MMVGTLWAEHCASAQFGDLYPPCSVSVNSVVSSMRIGPPPSTLSIPSEFLNVLLPASDGVSHFRHEVVALIDTDNSRKAA